MFTLFLVNGNVLLNSVELKQTSTNPTAFSELSQINKNTFHHKETESTEKQRAQSDTEVIESKISSQ